MEGEGKEDAILLRLIHALETGIVLAALLLGRGAARADVIVSTFGPGDSVAPVGLDGSPAAFTFGNPPGVDTTDHINVAAGFTPSRGFTLSRITCSIFAEPPFFASAGPPFPFSLSLVLDQGGLPTGRTLESWTALAFPNQATANVLSQSHAALVGGQRYWLVAQSPNPFDSGIEDGLAWSYGAQPAGLPTAYKLDAGSIIGTYHFPWRLGADSGPSSDLALRVEGFPLPLAPEPSSLVLLSLGLGGVVLRRLLGQWSGSSSVL
jgi:hypothetical protein